MEPRIVDRDTFMIMGTSTRITAGEESSEKFGLIWKAFEAHIPTIEAHSIDQAYYGISFPTGEEGVWDYIAGMAVKEEASTPESLVLREVPEARYVVFQCPLSKIGETYQHIFTKWLPESPYQLNGAAPVFEKYPPKESRDLIVQIHVPIREEG